MRFARLALVGLLAFLPNYSVPQEKQDKNDERVKLIGKMYRFSAGEDRILDAREKRSLLDKLGFELVIDENELLSFVPAKEDGKINVYLVSGGKFDRVLENGNYGFVGQITTKMVENYLKK
ncbi:MAG: hypothetical protein ACP5NS_04330 [Candidatus Pacearchaeota archaeon]